MEKGILSLTGWRAALALAYFGSAKLGLALAFTTPSVTAIWPPTGIALAALVLGGRRLWPGVALGAFAANVTTDIPVYTAIGIAIGNTLEAVVGASLLGWIAFRPSLDRLRDVFALVGLAGIVSTAISATIGVASLSLGDSLSDDALSAWRVWWFGDMGGDLLVAPFLFVAVTHWPYRRVLGRPLEALALLGGLIGVGVLVFSQSVDAAYAVFPFLIWAALRFLQPGAATASLIVATIAVVYTANGLGQFVVDSEDDSLLLAQTFSGVSGLSALILATVMSQRRRAERTAQDVARGFQTELLPPALPQIPQMQTAAWYRAGMQEQEVGGDFYDVFEAGPGRWIAVIGDVCGKGPEAASLTALARYTLRAVGREEVKPSEALYSLNQAILEQRSDHRFMTVALIGVSDESGRQIVTASSAGHPLPLLVRATGEVTQIGTAGTLLGIYPDPWLADHRVEMAAGDALILFTDGLNERRDPQDEPTRRIWDILSESAGSGANEITERLQGVAPEEDGEGTDDVALLVLRRTAPRDRAPRRTNPQAETWKIAVDLDPVPESAARARDAFSALRGELAEQVHADFELLVTELVSNSVRHAGLRPRESIHMRAAASGAVLRVEVSDSGTGFDPGAARPAPDGSAGWGLLLADRLADRWGVVRDGALTTVWAEKDLGPGPRSP
jgi:integral membrane sensor domain MASE1/anti-sigma regulatory factor (Ser/Thr protein kinase)